MRSEWWQGGMSPGRSAGRVFRPQQWQRPIPKAEARLVWRTMWIKGWTEAGEGGGARSCRVFSHGTESGFHSRWKWKLFESFKGGSWPKLHISLFWWRMDWSDQRRVEPGRLAWSLPVGEIMRASVGVVMQGEGSLWGCIVDVDSTWHNNSWMWVLRKDDSTFWDDLTPRFWPPSLLYGLVFPWLLNSMTHWHRRKIGGAQYSNVIFAFAV